LFEIRQIRQDDASVVRVLDASIQVMITRRHGTRTSNACSRSSNSIGSSIHRGAALLLKTNRALSDFCSPSGRPPHTACHLAL